MNQLFIDQYSLRLGRSWTFELKYKVNLYLDYCATDSENHASATSNWYWQRSRSS